MLRTRLLLPDLTDAAAQAEAAGLPQRLADRDVARRLTDWLERRPQLGRKVFARRAGACGRPDRAAAGLLDLAGVAGVGADLSAQPAAALAGSGRAGADAPAAGGDAAGRGPGGLPAQGGGQGPTARLQRRAALASTLVAGLELSRDGAALLDQDAAFGGIVVRPGDAGGALASRDAAA
jgi:segregation and condensation protein A